MICLFFIGCDNPFAPRLNTSTTDAQSILGDQTSIDGVFQKFKQAYTFRDSTIYGQLLASNFIFIYRDYDKGIDVFWGRDDEIRTTHGLFQNVLRLDLVWNTIINTSGDSIKQNIIRSFELTVTFSANDIVRLNGYANVLLERSHASDVWFISRWRDESNF